MADTEREDRVFEAAERFAGLAGRQAEQLRRAQCGFWAQVAAAEREWGCEFRWQPLRVARPGEAA